MTSEQYHRHVCRQTFPRRLVIVAADIWDKKPELVVSLLVCVSSCIVAVLWLRGIGM